MDLIQKLFQKEISPNTFFLIAGPCVIENEKVIMHTAERLREICNKLAIPLIFKSSYEKANRTSVKGFTGIGNKEALDLLKKVKDTFQIPILTDIHTEEEAYIAAQYVDILQIPAFLCRQTALLKAAAKTGKIVNIKKGQFMSPQAMQFALEKVTSQGNEQVMLTERGTTFGYNDLVVDFRSIPIMKDMGKPVVMDCTHSVQQPNLGSGYTGGTPQYVATMAACGIVSGAHGLFIETHPMPEEALSDGANMLPLKDMESLLQKLIAIKMVM